MTVLLGVLLLAGFFYWAFVITEGAYLGARTVALTYDVTARRYDDIKQFNRGEDVWFLAQPMLKALDGADCPLVLDVATGTGRLPDALLSSPRFDGTVIGLDLARKMLREAETKLERYAGRYTLIHQDAQDLPFQDESFDAVACLEALEFMPSPPRVLNEMARVLRPGGILLVTNRINWESALMPGKAFSKEELSELLEGAGMSQVEFRPWQVYYDLIWARKTGSPSRLGRGTWPAEDVLRCPNCAGSPVHQSLDEIHCPSCKAEYPISDNVYLMTRRARQKA